MAKYKSRLATECVQFADQLRHGYVLTIDPSSGSSGSVPGYAIFREGKLADLGTIELPRGTRKVANRLYLLRETLEKSFVKPDVLIVELISPVMPVGGGRFQQAKNTGQLMKSVGAIMSQWDCPLLECAPVTWRKFIPPNYKKSDWADAAMLGFATLITLARALGEEDPVVNLPANCLL